ncbi:unnamed protein product [Heterobilharzia americana]|nr:unnamed protein product [Heterobilharzia americana]
MWWLMQHYFGIGSRMHHVRLRWGHLRLVSGVVDPLTGELCDAVEYVGPSAFTTAKACALLESNPSSQESPFRRVYPSSGWGEAEIAVAAALASELGMNRPRVRPLDTDPSVPPVPARSGPDFVSLYKSFARHRQQASLLPDAPFYVQPLQNSASALQSKAAIAWFSIGALGKNRIGALMRNIVDKVVRPDMPRVATAALSAATTACVIAADRAALALTDCHTSNTSDLSNRQQSLVDRLSCLLGTNMSNTMNMKTDILSNESPSNKNNHSMNINLSNDDSSGTINKTNTVLLSRLENPETNVLLLSSSSTGQLPSMMTTHSDIRNASHLVLKCQN